jgi:putative ABC transport system substrate-binding protein
MKRREVITLLGGAAAWPLAARAQPPAMPVVGVLLAGFRRNDDDELWQAFRQGLRDTGFIEGQNVAVEYRFADNQAQRARNLADELVRRRVTVIVAAPNHIAIVAAKDATTTIPIVFYSAPDPVRTGLVASLNRPGGNLTGVTSLSADLTAKRLGLLHGLLPQAALVAILLGRAPGQADPEFQLQAAQAAGHSLGLRILSVQAGEESEFESALASAAREGAQALLVSTSIFFVDRRERLIALAARHRLPAIYQNREFTVSGGLMSYGPSRPDAYRQVGVYAGRILKGENPADMPVMLPTKFEFIINLQAAKALGFNIPATLLAIADEVIE